MTMLLQHQKTEITGKNFYNEYIHIPFQFCAIFRVIAGGNDHI